MPDIAIVQVICPSVTPVYNNNPGFGLLTIDSSTDISFVFTFLQLEDYHRYGVFTYEDYEPAAEQGFNLADASSVRTFYESLLFNFNHFCYWQARNYGLSKYLAAGAQFVWPLSYDNPYLDP